MSDPPGHVSDPAVKDSRLNQPPTSREFAGNLTDTFTAWLENLKPALEPGDDTVTAQFAVAEAPPVGELRFEGTLRVDCYVAGRLRSLTGTLLVSETAEIESNIFVATAIIDGVMHGDIHATERVELQSHARVFGSIESPALAIQPGAIFEGQCHFLSAPFKSATADTDGGQRSSPSLKGLPDPPSTASDETEVLAHPFAAVVVAT